eukprot:7731-Heterococcus_DN1.PRE.3
MEAELRVESLLYLAHAFKDSGDYERAAQYATMAELNASSAWLQLQFMFFRGVKRLYELVISICAALSSAVATAADC